MKAFHPIPGSTVSIAATSTSANIAIPTAALLATSVRVVITSGTAFARIRSGVGNTTTATSLTANVGGDPAVLPTSVECFSINAGDTYIAAKTDAGTCTVEFTFGFGA